MNQEGGDSIHTNADSNAPEKALTNFALHLALLEKTATGLGTLGFIWATVVLLGGFAITLDTTDFWFITVILVIEGTRIFSRSHELEWQHQATLHPADGTQPIPPLSNLALQRSSSHDQENQIANSQSSRGTLLSFCTQNINNLFYWSNATASSANEVTADGTRPIPPSCICIPWVFITRNIGTILYWLQLVSAATCVVLSLIKLIVHNFGHIEKGDTDKRNRRAALFIFYTLALAEALLFIIEKVYWEWTARRVKLLERVNEMYGLGPEGMVSTRRFFYDAYSKSINGSVFDSSKMDMISFAIELVTSNSPNEQLIGVRLLRQLSTNVTFATATLRKIGVDMCVIERLVEMLNWRNPNEREIRQSAAEILVQVASQKQNSLRIAEIPGAVESVASLLQTNRKSYTRAGDEICQRGDMLDQEDINVQKFNYLGLKILNKLSHDHDNCGKIGNNRGLLPKIIDFTYTTEAMFINSGDPNPHITTARQSLKLVKMLVSATGIAGDNLRKEISEIVLTISYLRNILKNGIAYPKLRLLGIEVLTNLGLEDDATDKIGGTGGVLKELLNIFFLRAETVDEQKLRNAAGDAIAMLTLESKNNCHRVLGLGAMENLVEAVDDEALCVNTARIIRNLCIYTDEDDDDFKEELKRVVVTAPKVLRAIMTASNKHQEVMIGLALHVFKDMKPDEFINMIQSEGHSAHSLATKLVEILKNHYTPLINVPRIRRFAIELAIWMMNKIEETIQTFRDLGLEREVVAVTQTATEIENFHLFSGTVGVSRHAKSIQSLAADAFVLVHVSRISKSKYSRYFG